MATIAPPSLVAAPARTPLPFGLGSVIAWRSGERWEAGVEWQGITCEPAGGRGGPNCDPEFATVGLPKEFDGAPSFGSAEPFVVMGTDECSPIGGGGFAEGQARAEAHLVAREDARAEQALWTGDLGNVPNFSGANGATPPIEVGDFATALDALAAIEKGIADTYGSLGVIHMSRDTATLLGKHLEKRGGRLYTRALDTPVVAGAGYPEGEMVGSPALVGYRSDVIASTNRPGDLLDRANNVMYSIAERVYVIGYDDCGVVHATFPAPEEAP